MRVTHMEKKNIVGTPLGQFRGSRNWVRYSDCRPKLFQRSMSDKVLVPSSPSQERRMQGNKLPEIYALDVVSMDHKMVQNMAMPVL